MLKVGDTLEKRYRILSLIGQGGFGAVYRAWDANVSQLVAVKESLGPTEEAQRQFEREAMLLAGLRHPNLPRVTDHFVILEQGQYLVLDLVEGKSLYQMMVEHGGPLDESQVLGWTRQVCEALTYLHSLTPPIVHRDIKPDNIIVTSDGKAMLVDFGISKAYDPAKGTTIGAKAVTRGFSPPEQYGSGRTEPRSDVYALGATLYLLLTGRMPPEAPDLASGAEELTPPNQLNPALSKPTSSTILAAIVPNISERLPSVKAFVDGLATTNNAPASGPPAGSPSAAPTLRVATSVSMRRLVVDPQKGDHSTIAKAIKAAQPGDRIEVQPGVYKEAIVIDKPLEIVGQGPMAKIVISSSVNVVNMSTSSAAIRNLTLRQTGGKWHAIDVSQGHLEIEDCDISSEGRACVAVYNGAMVSVRKSRIHHSKDYGILVSDLGQGLIEDNDILANHYAGIKIETSGNPTIRLNRIHNGEAEGISVGALGKGVIDDNDVARNARGGIKLDGGNTTVRNNRIHDNKYNGGILVEGRAQVMIEDNDILGNEGVAVAINGSGHTTVRKNRIREPKPRHTYSWGIDGGQGIAVSGQGHVVIGENEIAGTAAEGIEVYSGRVDISQNHIHNGHKAGITMHKGRCLIEDNNITGNAGEGIDVYGGRVTARKNRINRNKSAAVYLASGSRGVIEDNDLRDNVDGPFRIYDMSAKLFVIRRNNKIG